MRTLLFFFICILSWSGLNAQSIRPSDVQPDSTNYENIYVKKLSDDSLRTTYVIWIKKGVKTHYHAYHTELIHVLEGTGDMTLGDSTFAIKKGDFFVIPKRTHHSVVTTSDIPLKVISVQTPQFDGDRIWVDE